jgi:hypothetical protein
MYMYMYVGGGLSLGSTGGHASILICLGLLSCL